MISALVVPIPVRADEPKVGRTVLESRGHLVPGSQITVSPKVAGQVVELLIEEGQQVKAGDLLARLDAVEYEGVLRLARARLKLAEAELAKAREGAGKADRRHRRGEGRGRPGRGPARAIPAGRHCHPRPIDGVVLAKRAGVGGGSTREPLRRLRACDLADPRTMEVEGPDPSDLEGHEGAGVRDPGGCPSNTTLRGRVARMQPVAHRASAVAVRVRLEMAAANEHLRPELSAVVQFVTQE